MKSEKLQHFLRKLPRTPGVYLMKDARGGVLYVGKASILKNRVSSYFMKAHDGRIEQMVGEIADIEIRKTPTIIEALILEANLIKEYRPKYNIREKDDKSFLYVVFTKDAYPKIQLLRGLELKEKGSKKFKAVFGPFTSSASLRAALKFLRKIFRWSNCEPGQRRPCFYYHIGQCPGICVGKITPREYAKTVRHLLLFFRGKKSELLKEMKKEMRASSKEKRFETAAKLRDQIYAIEHIRDVAFIKREDEERMINMYGRIEGYDISNTSGTDATGSMVVFENAEANKNAYRKFKIKTVKGPNDVAMMKEVLRRRFSNNWPLPDLILIDGGRGQLNAAREALREKGLAIPLVGIAKGITRKKDEFLPMSSSLELKRLIENNPLLLKHVRDEAHRFAVSYHRKLRGERMKKK